MTNGLTTENVKQAFYCEYNIHTNDKHELSGEWLITTDEEEARETDQSYRLASLSDLHDWKCVTNQPLTDILSTKNGLCKWVEGERADTLYGGQEEFGEYQLLTGEECYELFKAGKLKTNDTNGFNYKDLTTTNIQLLHYLLDFDYNNYIDFVTNHYTCKQKQSVAIMKFRFKKISSLNLSYIDFMKQYIVDPKKSLQTLFQQNIDHEDFLYMISKIANGEFSIKQLFDRHKQQPTKLFMRHVLSLTV